MFDRGSIDVRWMFDRCSMDSGSVFDRRSIVVSESRFLARCVDSDCVNCFAYVKISSMMFVDVR